MSTTLFWMMTKKNRYYHGGRWFIELHGCALSFLSCTQAAVLSLSNIMVPLYPYNKGLLFIIYIYIFSFQFTVNLVKLCIMIHCVHKFILIEKKKIEHVKIFRIYVERFSPKTHSMLYFIYLFIFSVQALPISLSRIFDKFPCLILDFPSSKYDRIRRLEAFFYEFMFCPVGKIRISILNHFSACNNTKWKVQRGL